MNKNSRRLFVKRVFFILTIQYLFFASLHSKGGNGSKEVVLPLQNQIEELLNEKF